MKRTLYILPFLLLGLPLFSQTETKMHISQLHRSGASDGDVMLFDLGSGLWKAYPANNVQDGNGIFSLANNGATMGVNSILFNQNTVWQAGTGGRFQVRLDAGTAGGSGMYYPNEMNLWVQSDKAYMGLPNDSGTGYVEANTSNEVVLQGAQVSVNGNPVNTNSAVIALRDIDRSASVKIAAPSVVNSTYTVTLPPGAPTGNDQYLAVDADGTGEWKSNNAGVQGFNIPSHGLTVGSYPKPLPVRFLAGGVDTANVLNYLNLTDLYVTEVVSADSFNALYSGYVGTGHGLSDGDYYLDSVGEYRLADPDSVFNDLIASVYNGKMYLHQMRVASPTPKDAQTALSVQDSNLVLFDGHTGATTSIHVNSIPGIGEVADPLWSRTNANDGTYNTDLDNVGINTTSTPDEALTVNGDIKMLGAGALHFGNTSDQLTFQSPYSNHLQLKQAGTVRWHWNAVGNMGYGTTLPSATIDVNTTTNRMLTLNYTNSFTNFSYQSFEYQGSEKWRFGSNAEDFNLAAGSGKTAFSADQATGNTAFGNNVGIGISTAGGLTERLTVAGGNIHINGSSGEGLHLTPTLNNSYINAPSSTEMALYTSGTERVRLNTSGNMGVGVSNAQERIHTDGTIRLDGAANNPLATKVAVLDGNNVVGSFAINSLFTHTKEGYVASAGQTVFTLSDNALSGTVRVIVNQYELMSTHSEFSHSGDTVTISTGLAAGDLVEIQYIFE